MKEDKLLRKMLLQGLAAAVLIGGAAVVYAQAQDNGYLSAPQTKTVDNPNRKEGVKEHADRRAEHDRDRANGERHAGEDD
ncbi:hypothetical protein [Reyranella soli]|uniref:Uncharacterized protein n=1 Tax=Reyranella soli TaxID=1230389 RepID=A0A512NCW0_9HYPH|nr:hypothetical protein [Reyranella soli]GEP56780.1 hypothetical protein RSO01_39460 [Reyranella soli]